MDLRHTHPVGADEVLSNITLRLQIGLIESPFGFVSSLALLGLSHFLGSLISSFKLVSSSPFGLVDLVAAFWVGLI